MRFWDWILFAACAMLLAYEVRAHFGDEYQTITALLRRAAAWSPIVALIYGLLGGHLFWNK